MVHSSWDVFIINKYGLMAEVDGGTVAGVELFSAPKSFFSSGVMERWGSAEVLAGFIASTEGWMGGIIFFSLILAVIAGRFSRSECMHGGGTSQRTAKA